MTKYDKIYIPHNPKKHGVTMDDNYHVTHEGWGSPDFRQEVVPEKNVIVVTTVEELRELWYAAKNRETQAHSGINTFPDLKTYLESKGINI